MTVTSPDPQSSPVYEARGIVKTFPGVRALRDVSISLRAGEVHALVGENGAGKSTLIKVLTGVYQADAGQLLLAGDAVSFASPRAAQDAGISTIYQEVNLVPLQSGARNLYFGREPRTRLGLVDEKKMVADARSLLRELRIDVDPTVPVASLALGAQQMISVARAVSLDARVVIMDEPTSSLETREVETLFGLIDRLRGSGIALVYVSHRLDELYRICDTVTVLRDGQLVHTGRLADLPRQQLVASMLGRELLAQHARSASTTTYVDDVRPALSAKGLTKRALLHGVSVDIRPGEVVGLGGLLGAGRSETAKAILGALSIDAGTVEVDGKPVPHGSPAQSIEAGVVMLSEDRKAEGILPNLSIRDNIILAALPRLSRRGLFSDGAADKLVDTFMKRLNIKAYGPGQKVGTLSGGNQQKVLLARWLCLEPKVLMLDEPTRGIDVGAKAEVRRLVDELAEQGLAVLLISSETEELVDGAHRVLVLRDGAVVGELGGAELTEEDLVRAIAGAGTEEAS
ncbi:MAG: galactofuranose transport system ATP-binding protein [Frankiaceae bacterium]|jgi:ribose transport system ATP-binding protein|nr:galactofuranose transport system ATP-binding protein [Frankiaceae bacterium]